MAGSGLSNALVMTPIPIVIGLAAVVMRQVATSGTRYSRPSELSKWLRYAAITLGAGLVCGLYADGMRLLRDGWPPDPSSAFAGTLAFLIFAVAAMPVMVVAWLISLVFKTLFGGAGCGDDWDFPGL